MTVSLRPHHVLCSIGFEGRGYDGPFIANMSRIVMQVLRSPDGPKETIQITTTADAICAPCPKRRGLGCETQARVDRLDAAHTDILGLQNIRQLSWAECLERVVTRVAPDDLDRICEGCQWLPLGVCKTRLADGIAAYEAKQKRAASQQTAPD